MVENNKLQQNPQPQTGEILTTDIYSTGFGQFAYNLSISLNSLNPTAVWEQMQYDPWLAMTVYRDIELKDDAVSSSLEKRKDAVLSKERRVLPASEKRQDKKIAEFVEETLERFYNPILGASGDQSSYTGFEGLLWELLDAVGKGVTIGEINWQYGDDRIYVEDVKFHPQYLFSFTEDAIAAVSSPTYFGRQTGPLRLRMPYLVKDKGVEENGKLPAYKFLVGTYKPLNSNRWGSAVIMKCFWLSWFKRAGLRQMLRYVDKGSGSVLTRYKSGASQEEKAQALNAAVAINEESAVSIPDKFAVEILEAVRTSVGDVHEGLIDRLCNNGIIRIIEGGTLTSRGSEGGGSRALGDVHEGVRGEKTEGDSKFLMQVVNRQLVYPVVLYNFGPNVKLPVWAIDYDPKRDLSADSIVHTRLTKELGLPVPKKFFYEHYNLPKPSEGEEFIGPDPEQTDNPELPSTGVDSSADFAEKKTPKSNATSLRQSRSKITRFSKLRPSTMTF